jgi:hypothetical protein
MTQTQRPVTPKRPILGSYCEQQPRDSNWNAAPFEGEPHSGTGQVWSRDDKMMKEGLPIDWLDGD